MVDPSSQVVDLPQRHADVLGQLSRRALDTVTQAHHPDLAGSTDSPAVHGHRVDVVEESDSGAQFFHVAAHVQQDGDGAQGAHDATDAQGVANGLAQPVLLGDFKINHRAGLVASHLEHADSIVGTIQGRPAVGGGFDGGMGIQERGDLVRHRLRSAQTFLVNVVQADGRACQLRKTENVAQQVLGKDGAASTDESDLGHIALHPFEPDYTCRHGPL